MYHLTFFLPCLLTRQSQPWILLVFFARPFEDSSFQHLGGGYQLTEGEFVAVAGERCMGTSFIFFLALMMFPELFFNQIAPKNWISKVGLKMKHQKKQVCEARTQKHCFFQDETLTITNESHSFATFSAAPVGELGRWVHLFLQRETSTVQGGSNYSFTGLFGPATNLEEMLKEYEQTVFFVIQLL